MNKEDEDFIKCLYTQVFQCLPQDITFEEQVLIERKIFENASKISDILSNEEFSDFDIDTKHYIIQMCMEWALYKSVDFIHSHIEYKYMDNIIRNVVLAVFQETKRCIRLKIELSQKKQFIEDVAQNIYKSEMQNLREKNIISNDEYIYAIRASYIDEISEDDNEQSTQVEDSEVNNEIIAMDKFKNFLKVFIIVIFVMYLYTVYLLHVVGKMDYLKLLTYIYIHIFVCFLTFSILLIGIKKIIKK